MLNLHPPFRWATHADAAAVSALSGDAASHEGAVVAEEGGRVVAVLAGAPAGETWHVEALAVEEGRAAELGPRLLAVADALAADEGLAAVGLRPETCSPAELREMLDAEGFRAAPDESGAMLRPVVPQG